MKIEKLSNTSLKMLEIDNDVADAGSEGSHIDSITECVSSGRTVREMKILHESENRFVTIDDLATNRTMFNKLFCRPKQFPVFMRSISLPASVCDKPEFYRSLSDGAKDTKAYPVKEEQGESPVIVNSDISETDFEFPVADFEAVDDSSDSEVPRSKRARTVALECGYGKLYVKLNDTDTLNFF